MVFQNGSNNSSLQNFNLPNTSSTAGQLIFGTTVMLSNFGNDNAFIGGAGNTTLTGASNVGIDNSSLLSLTTGAANFAGGVASLSGLTDGSDNVAIGDLSLISLPHGNQNVAIGASTGGNYTNAESNNILIGYNVTGQPGDMGITYIGNASTQTAAYIAGVTGSTTVINPNYLVSIDSVTGRFNNTLINPTLLSGTFDTDAGGVATPIAGVLQIIANLATLNCGSSVSFSAPGTSNIVQLNLSDTFNNTILGFQAGVAGITGANNLGLGRECLGSLTSGSSNIAIGYRALGAVDVNNGNIAIGDSCLLSNDGSANVVIGESAGNNYNGAESYNVLLGATCGGLNGESFAIHIADATSSNQALTCYIGGIVAVTTTPNPPNLMMIDSVTGQLANTTFNVVSSGSNTIIGTTSGNTTMTGQENTGLGSASLDSLTSGAQNTALGSFALGSITTASNNVSIGRESLLNLTTGNGNTVIGTNCGFNYAGPESGNILIGSDLLGVTFESNVTRIGVQGTQAQAYIAGISGVVITPANLNIVTIDVTTGQLGSEAAGSIAGSFQTDFGTAAPIAGVLEIISGYSTINSGSSVNFSAPGSSNIVQLNVTDVNYNTLIGNLCGNSGASTTANTCNGFGQNVLSSVTSGADLIGMGAFALQFATSAGQIVAIGTSAGQNILTGQNCLLIGHSAGSNYSGSESGNILLGSFVQGTVGENFVIRIGLPGTQAACHIAGIDGVNVGSTAQVVTEVGSQLGSAVITAGTGITVTPTANVITIAANPVLPYTNVAATPYTVTATDEYISVNTTTLAITIKLPNAPATGRIYTVKDRIGNAATHNITVTTVGGGVTIDGVTSYLIIGAYDAVSFLFNGTSYEVY